MIISRTPFRVSFFGGGTDYPSWYRRYGGAVLSATIDKYCYITCRYLPPFFEHRFRIVYSKTENCHTVGEIKHPVVREVLRYLGVERGLEIHHDGDLPARSGVGSSSSFAVGLLHALYALKGIMPGKRQLAHDAIYIEQEVLSETVGSQDQVAAAYGGFNRITFLPSGEIFLEPITLSPARLAELCSHLMLFYTGVMRTASSIAGTYIQDIESKHGQLRRLGGMVDEGISILNGEHDILSFGELLREAWEIKRALSPGVANALIEDVYDEAISAGAIGGKLLGAGGGGFLLLFVPPSRQIPVKESLRKLINVPFTFAGNGSQIIFFDPETEYPAEEEIRARREVEPFQEATRISIV